MNLKDFIRSIPDYPKKGILFRDITTLIKNEKAFSETIDQIIERSKKTILNPFYQYGRSQGLNKFGIRLLTPTFSQKPNFLIVKEKDSLYCNGYGIHYNY